MGMSCVQISASYNAIGFIRLSKSVVRLLTLVYSEFKTVQLWSFSWVQLWRGFCTGLTLTPLEQASSLYREWHGLGEVDRFIDGCTGELSGNG